MRAVSVLVKKELLIFGFGTKDLAEETEGEFALYKLPANAELGVRVNAKARRNPKADFFIFTSTP